ncbi:MAG: cyclic nucleotide-binding domain-containing protein, partial [Chloroflexi bacterium]
AYHSDHGRKKQPQKHISQAIVWSVAGVRDRLSALAVRWRAILVAVSPSGHPSEVGLVPVVSQLRHHARELRVRWLLSNLIPGVLVRFLWLPLVRVILPSMSDPKTEALGRVPVFAGCSREELEFLVTRTDEVDVQAGRTLIRQGKPGDTFYVLLEGEADVDVDGQARPSMQAGSFFGEISMLDRGPATATVVTKTPAKLMVMSHVQFRDAIKANDQLLSHVMRAAAERMRRDSLERQRS